MIYCLAVRQRRAYFIIVYRSINPVNLDSKGEYHYGVYLSLILYPDSFFWIRFAYKQPKTLSGRKIFPEFICYGP